MVTDSATFAWLCDVFVDASVRGLGIGSALVAGVCADLEPLKLRRVLLATGDAHGVYAKFGFEPLPNPERWMSHARSARRPDLRNVGCRTQWQACSAIHPFGLTSRGSHVADRERTDTRQMGLMLS